LPAREIVNRVGPMYDDSEARPGPDAGRGRYQQNRNENGKASHFQKVKATWRSKPLAGATMR
jgi:hypothetical protein